MRQKEEILFLTVDTIFARHRFALLINYRNNILIIYKVFLSFLAMYSILYIFTDDT